MNELCALKSKLTLLTNLKSGANDDDNMKVDHMLFCDIVCLLVA